MKTAAVIVTTPPHYAIGDPRAIDGDTIEGTIILDFGVCIRKRIRLKGFFAPEKDGPNPTSANLARLRLQEWLNGHALHLAAQGMKEDRYGRLVAWILGNGRGADPHAILGDLQLSEAAHAAELKFARSAATGKRGAL